jgi:hypothetical protein
MKKETFAETFAVRPPSNSKGVLAFRQGLAVPKKRHAVGLLRPGEDRLGLRRDRVRLPPHGLELLLRLVDWPA